MAKVCLISPPGRASSTRPPLALMYLSSYLENKGISTTIIDIKTTDKENKKIITNNIINKVKTENPKIIGITCFSPEVLEVLELCNTIKKHNNQIKTIVGGVHPTLSPEDFIFPKSAVDFAVIGEGEETLNELSRALIKKEKNIDNIPGIAYWDKQTNKLHKTKPREYIEDIDEIPFPAYDKVDMKYYTRPQIFGLRYMLLSTAYIFTSRGCPYNCTFCVNRNIWKKSGCSSTRVRFRSCDKVLDEIEFLKKNYKIDSFYVYDDTFSLKKDRVIEFCEKLKKRNLKLIWGCETRVNLANEEMLKQMRDAGCVQIDFGVESGSEAALQRIKKGITVKQILSAFNACKKLGIRSFANFMFNTPGETEKDVDDTLRISKAIDADVYSFFIMTPYPGTEIYEEHGFNLTPKDYHILDIATRKNIERFRLSKHGLDLKKLIYDANKRFNSASKQLSFLFQSYYWKQLIRSQRKSEYALETLRCAKLFIKSTLGITSRVD